MQTPQSSFEQKNLCEDRYVRFFRGWRPLCSHFVILKTVMFGDGDCYVRYRRPLCSLAETVMFGAF